MRLSEPERAGLYAFAHSGSANAQAFKRTQILLAADGEGVKDGEIAKAVGVSEATVYNTRRRYLESGAEFTLKREPRKDKGIPEKVDGRVEAHIIARAGRWPAQLGAAPELPASKGGGPHSLEHRSNRCRA